MVRLRSVLGRLLLQKLLGVLSGTCRLVMWICASILRLRATAERPQLSSIIIDFQIGVLRAHGKIKFLSRDPDGFERNVGLLELF